MGQGIYPETRFIKFQDDLPACMLEADASERLDHGCKDQSIVLITAIRQRSGSKMFFTKPFIVATLYVRSRTTIHMIVTISSIRLRHQGYS